MLIDDLNRLIFKGQGMQEKSIRRGEIYRWRKSYAIFPGCFLILKVTYFLFYFKKRKDLKTKQPYFTIQVMVQDGRRQPPWPWWLLLLQLLLSAEHVCFGAQAKIKKSRDARIKKKKKKKKLSLWLARPVTMIASIFIYAMTIAKHVRSHPLIRQIYFSCSK